MPLDPATAALLNVAAALNDPDGGWGSGMGRSEGLVALMRRARDAGAAAAWLEELVLSSVLFVGFPRALVAAAALRAVEPVPGDAGDAADYAAWRLWEQRGEETCRKIYGDNYQKLRRNVRALHPALDAWILMDGYGRTLSRPGLDPRRRELCAIAMLVPQGVPRQLHSHLRGALNVGATAEEVEAVLSLLADLPAVPRVHLESARALWSELKAAP